MWAEDGGPKRGRTPLSPWGPTLWPWNIFLACGIVAEPVNAQREREKQKASASPLALQSISQGKVEEPPKAFCQLQQ